MTEKKIKNRILTVAALAITFSLCALFMYVGANADDDTTSSSSEAVSLVEPLTELPAESTTEIQTAPTTTRATKPTSVTRTTWTNPYRSTTSRHGNTVTEVETTNDTVESGTSGNTEISSTRRSTMTGIPNDYNRTTYRGEAKTVESGTYTTEPTVIPTVTLETFEDSGNMSGYTGIAFDFDTYENTEEETTGEETEAQANPLYKRLAAGFAAAALLLAVGGAGFALWYRKEKKLKEQQKDLYKF